MKLQILGTGCPKCKALEDTVKKAVSKVGGFHEVEKVEDVVEIMSFNVMSTPALVINGKVKSNGKLLNEQEVISLMNSSS
ncbi:thioredoxin family protein [Malaciobacter canalis]|uniref:thioredoxin family protein n=1 Tax=Malaciobacter canalis TaxID=1912871 RepID=UPI003850FE97